METLWIVSTLASRKVADDKDNDPDGERDVNWKRITTLPTITWMNLLDFLYQLAGNDQESLIVSHAVSE